VTEAGALDAIDRILNRGGDADDVLREIVRVLPEQVPSLAWAGVSFAEEGRLVPGPSSGTPEELRRVAVPVSYRGERVGELAVDGEAGAAFLERVATLISAHVLLGWDTGGERWEA
jgi:putative methionine-R-sulfoxide reductase with GAF domain